jgi:hypothetical protein
VCPTYYTSVVPGPKQKAVNDVAAEMAEEVVAVREGDCKPLALPVLHEGNYNTESMLLSRVANPHGHSSAGDYNTESMRIVRTTKPLPKPRAKQ